MRKTGFFLFTMLVISCKSTSTVTSTKLDNKAEVMLKGDWVITSVDYPGKEYFSVNSFNISDSKCFTGSSWNFISNNNKGQMILNNSSTKCLDFSSPITWYVNKDGKFVLKIINGHKATQVDSGYILELKNVSENSFSLVDKIKVSESVKDITYTFQRK